MNNLKTLAARAALAGSSAMFAVGNFFMNPGNVLTAFASTAAKDATKSDFDDVTEPITQLMKQVTLGLIPLVGAVGAVYCILLGVKFAKAEEPQEREKAKAHLKNAIIGYVLIFVLVVALNRLTPIMTSWMVKNANK